MILAQRLGSGAQGPGPLLSLREPLECGSPARSRLWQEASVFADDWKEKALTTVFLEPTKMYYTACRERGLADNVEVHGATVYIAVLMSTLGVRSPRFPFLLDYSISAVSFLDTLDASQVTELWHPDNFGKPFSAVPGCRTPRVRGRIPNHFFNFLFTGMQPWQIANSAVDPRDFFVERRKKLQVYLEQFAWYFSEEFLVPRLTQHLLDREETREALQAVFEELPPAEQAEQAEELDVRFWLWNLEVLPAQFRIDRAVRLLRLAGLLREDRDPFILSSVS